MLLNDGDSTVESGNISSTMYEATSLFISDFDVTCRKAFAACLGSRANQRGSAGLSTSFVGECCLCRCLVRFDVVFVAVDSCFWPGQSVHFTVTLFPLCATNS